MWEDSLAEDLTEDLQYIAGQLLRLGELLTVCMCVSLRNVGVFSMFVMCVFSMLNSRFQHEA